MLAVSDFAVIITIIIVAIIFFFCIWVLWKLLSSDHEELQTKLKDNYNEIRQLKDKLDQM